MYDDTTMHAPGQASARIAVLTLRRVEKGNLKAFVDVQLGGIVVRDFRLIQQPGQRAWVSPPQREWEGGDGRKRYAPIVELSEALRQRVEQAILQAWQAEEDRQ